MITAMQFIGRLFCVALLPLSLSCAAQRNTDSPDSWPGTPVQSVQQEEGNGESEASRLEPAQRLAAGAAVAELLEPLAGHGYAGAVSFGTTEELVHAKGYGLRDRERALPFESSTLVDIGSLTKVFTASLILRLEERGLLSVEDPIGRHLPSVPADKSGITVHQLLTHTAGLTRSALSLDVDDDTDRPAFLEAVLASDLLYPAGDRYLYSDTGYDLLAALVEVVTGRRYADVLRDEVLEPAGLRATGYSGDPSLRDVSVADSYTAPLGSPWYERREGPSNATWYNIGSGGLLSNVEDLQTFVRALASGRVVAAGAFRRMTRSHTDAGAGGYGYGWFVEGDGSVAYHGGDIAGYKALLRYDAERDAVFAAVDNVFGWERVTDRWALAAWEGHGPTPPPPASNQPTLASWAGTYRTADGTRLVVWPEAGVLVVEVAGQRAVDAVFAVGGAGLGGRTRAAERVIAALETGDEAFLASIVRDRDRLSGMPRRLLAIWQRLAERRGPAESVEVAGSFPAQDGTVVSWLDVARDGEVNPLRLIWRGDRLVAFGGAEDMRGPTVTLTPTAHDRAVRFEPSTGGTATLRRTARGALVLEFDGVAIEARRDTAAPVAPPAPSLLRAAVPVFIREGPPSGLEHLRRWESRPQDGFDLGEGSLNDLGYRLLHADAVESAIAVFAWNASRHPGSWNAHDSLGEAYLAAGQTDAARAAYAESLRLNADNETARRVLAETSGGG